MRSMASRRRLEVPTTAPSGRSAKRRIVRRDEGIARILAFEHRAEREAVGQLHRHVLERMHGEVRAADRERGLELLDEQPLAADLRKRAIEDLVAARRHSENFDVARWI